MRNVPGGEAVYNRWSTMHIGLLFDLQTDAADERQAEFDPPSTIQALRAALESLGHRVTEMGSALELLEAGPKRWCDIDLVFNVSEGLRGRNREAWAPIVLDLYRIPYAGSDGLALMLGLDKVMSKRLAKAEGLPTPGWVSLEHPGALPSTIPLQFPLIVKPRWEGSGRGIDAGAVVADQQRLSARVQWLFAHCPGPILIEEFISGGELTVQVIGNDPPVAYPAIQRPIDAATGLSCHVVKPTPTRWECPLELTETIEPQARQVALTMVEALGCCDMARVDLRVDRAGAVQFLEINPLPSFDPAGSFGLLAEHLGTTYAQLIGRILQAACVRLGMALPHTQPEPTASSRSQ